MRKYSRFFTVAAALLLILMLGACASSNAPFPTQTGAAAGAAQVRIAFDFKKQSGYASNQFAVWIEDSAGNLVRTLYATSFTVKGGYKNRPDAIPTWVNKANPSSMQAADVDAVTGATPSSGELFFLWDLKDGNGDLVPNGDYSFFVEGSLRWKNRVLYSGIISVGGTSTTAQANVEYIYEASDDQPALTGDSAENAMIGNVTMEYTPAG